MEADYYLKGDENMGAIKQIYESFDGSYWIITNTSNDHPFGFAILSGMRQFGEWGTINKETFNRPKVWEVPVDNWEYTGPDQIEIVKE